MECSNAPFLARFDIRSDVSADQMSVRLFVLSTRFVPSLLAVLPISHFAHSQPLSAFQSVFAAETTSRSPPPFTAMQVLRRPGERPQRFHNLPPATPAQYRPVTSSSTFSPLSSLAQPPPPVVAAPSHPPPTTAFILDSIRPLFVHGRYSAALSRYQQLRITLLGSPDSRSVEWLVETARVWRMIGECQQKLEAWQDSSLSLSSALSLVDSAIDLPTLPRHWRYDVLILQQQLHHLMGDTHLALSETMSDDDTAAAIELAREAVQYGRKGGE